MPAQDSPSFPPGYLDEWQGDNVYIYAGIFMVLQMILLGLRFWARSLGKVRWGLDDTLIIIAAVFLTGVTTACICDVVYGGVGHHIERVVMDNPDTLIAWWKFNLVVPLLYFLAAAFPKLSILALYFRVFGTRLNMVSRMICWITAFIIVGNCFANVLVTFFMCRPFAFIWDKTLQGSCIDINAWWRWCSFPNLVTDVIMLLQPIPHTLSLQAPTRVKAGLAMTFAVGSVGFITAIIRFVGFFTKDITKDSTWTGTSLLYLSIIEPGLYLVAGCLLSLRPLLKWARLRSPFPSRDASKTSSPSDKGSHIMKTMSFKVSQRDHFHELHDSESLMGLKTLARDDAPKGTNM